MHNFKVLFLAIIFIPLMTLGQVNVLMLVGYINLPLSDEQRTDCCVGVRWDH